MQTEQQIIEITSFCKAMGVKHYDVQMELVDHFAGMIDQLQEERPGLDFNEAFETAIGEFPSQEFRSIVKNKEEQLLKRFKRLWLKEFLAYFTFPKIMLVTCLTLVIISLNHFFDVGDFSDNIGYLVSMFGFFNLLQLKRGDIRLPTKKLFTTPRYSLLVNQVLINRANYMFSGPFMAYLFLGIIADMLKGFLRSKGYGGLNAVKVDVLLYPLPLFIVACLAWRKVLVDQIILMRKQYAAAFEN